MNTEERIAVLRRHGETTPTVVTSKYFEHTFDLLEPITERACSQPDCRDKGAFVQGYYLVGGRRRVRVWVCRGHWLGIPATLLPTPASIVAAENAEEIHLKNMAKHYRQDVAPERHESVKALAATGHGKAIPTDRIAAWRWGAY